MGVARSILPGTVELAEGLGQVLGGGVVVLGRHENVHASTFPSEFVSCRVGDGERLELFCKYAEDEIDNCFGHRGSTKYEGEVYQRLLGPLGVRAPRYFGVWSDGDAGRTWLVLERLVEAERVTEMAEPAVALQEAAGWLGRFHGMGVGSVRGLDFLIRHDADYYEGWMRRTIEFSEPLGRGYSWLERLYERREELIGPLLDGAVVLVHGECYPHNLLFRGGEVYAIDWQSAALAAGELDLAALTERWPEEVDVECQRAYRANRWPDGGEGGFGLRLAAARIHWMFRWLGDRVEWTVAERSRWRFERLRVLGEQMGLI